MEEKKMTETMEEKIQGEEIQDEEALEQAAGGYFRYYPEEYAIRKEKPFK